MSALLPLRLDGVAFQVGGKALLGPLELTVPAGLITTVLGPNGAGKSLLLRLCHGLLRPTAGCIVTHAGRIGIGPRERALQAMVLQRPVHLRRSALGNLTWALSLRGVPWRQRRRQATAALARFGLEALAERPARVLSGGEQQRLALARAWLAEPELLLLDEPTAALDPGATRAVEEAVRDFAARGTAVLVTTHDLAQARRLAEKIAFLDAGRLLEAGSADRFFARPLTPEAAAFLRGDLLAPSFQQTRTPQPCSPAAF